MALSAATAALAVARGAQAFPVLTRIESCWPAALTDASGGLGNTPASRQLDIRFAYSFALGDERQTAVDDTLVVQVCTSDASGNVTCPYWPDVDQPGTSPNAAQSAWAVYHRGVKDGAGAVPPIAELLVDPADANARSNMGFRIPLDYGDPANQSVFPFLRVNSTRNDTSVIVGGYCPVPVRTGERFVDRGGVTARFRAFAILDGRAGTQPFLGLAGVNAVCSGQTGLLAGAGPECIGQASLDFVLDRAVDFEQWQRQSVFAAVAPLTEPTSFNGILANSPDCPDGLCPHSIWIHGVPFNPTGQARDNGIYLRAELANASGGASLSFGAAGSMSLHAHEFFHSLQGAWSQAGAPIAGDVVFSEGSPSAIEAHFCLFNYPGLADPGQCVSPGKLGDTTPAGFQGLGRLHDFLNTPSNDNVLNLYRGGFFWRYVIEQFGLPIGQSPGHPGGAASAIEMDRNRVLGDAIRRSDEGVDLLGYLFTASRVNSGAAGLELVDSVLRERLGRKLDDVVLEMHTTALLKDYREIDDRWNFEWVGDFNAGAAAALVPGGPAPNADLSTLKPFTLVNWDLLPAALRSVDQALAAGESIGSSNEIILNAYGAAYLRIRPEQVAHDVRVKLLAGVVGRPRFRVFTVDAVGTPALRAECGNDPDGADPATSEHCTPDDAGNVDLLIPVDGTGAVSEVLVVASALSQPASLGWVIGDVRPTVAIITPTRNKPEYIGEPNAANGARPFLLEFVVRDEAGELLTGITQDLIEVSVGDCAAPGPVPCTVLAPGNFTLADLTGGVYWARVTAPPAAYPAGDDRIDVRVRINVTPAAAAETTEVDALTVNANRPSFSAELVFDTSGSMNLFAGAKLTALKQAASFLVTTLSDGDEMGIIQFANDAGTRWAIQPLTNANRADIDAVINGLTAVGCTAIGDGLLEAQSNLAIAYGDTPNPDRNQRVILFSDGQDTGHYTARRYYVLGEGPPDRMDGVGELPGESPCPETPDRGQWYGGLLNFHERREAGLSVPEVWTVGLGPDADLVTMNNIAATTGGKFAFVPGVGEAQQFFQMSLDLGDFFREVATIGEGSSRVSTSRASALGGLFAFEVEKNAADLKVSVATPGGRVTNLTLRSPSEARFVPTRTANSGLVFEVSRPEAGIWRFFVESEPPPPPPAIAASAAVQALDSSQFFSEASVSSALALLARVGVEDAEAGERGQDNRGWVGRDVYVRAVPTDGGTLTGVEVVAVVTAPDGGAFTLALLDDGAHADGAAADGVYGALFQQTSLAGAYQVKIRARGVSPALGNFSREALLGFELHGAPDADGDGLPDWWEARNGTQPTVPDSNADPDSDGLTSGQEFVLHTRPNNADTDAGGESDGSEVFTGRNPLNPADDFTSVFLPEVTACDGLVLLNFYNLNQSSELEVEAAPSFTGPYTRVFLGPVPANGQLTLPVANGTIQCYRTRTRVGSFGTTLTSAWSPPTCVTPAEDAFAPRVALRAGRPFTRTRLVQLLVEAWDDPASSLRPQCPERSMSGVVDMQVSKKRDFSDTTWQPYAREIEVRLDDRPITPVWAKVRDRAGNESEPAFLAIQLVSTTPLDSAIQSEERALDALKVKDFALARSAIKASLAELAKRNHTNLELEECLMPVETLKRKALVFLFPHFHRFAEKFLNEALKRERACADRAATDVDTDEIPEFFDNCVGIANPDQEDRNQDGIGDACELVPLAECVLEKHHRHHRHRHLVASFGYTNPDTVTKLLFVGLFNQFDKPPRDRGQPNEFQPGEHRSVFSVDLHAHSTLTWRLGDRVTTANHSSPRCPTTPK